MTTKRNLELKWEVATFDRHYVKARSGDIFVTVDFLEANLSRPCLFIVRINDRGEDRSPNWRKINFMSPFDAMEFAEKKVQEIRKERENRFGDALTPLELLPKEVLEMNSLRSSLS